MKRDITFKTLELRVEYSYFPGEPPYKYDADLAGYPGSDDKIEISSVYIRITNHTVNLTSFFEETGLIYTLEEQLLKEIHEEND
jgi:hypothetical protein